MSDPADLDRRRWLALATAAGLGAAAPTTVRAAGDAGWLRLRRVVTTDGADGRGVVLADGAPGNTLVLNGTRITRLWESAEVPVPLPATADLGATAGNAYREGFRGTSFYLAEIPGGAAAPEIPMHRQDTLDYMAVMSGRIALVLEDRELVLDPGDTLVQAGNLHTWINRWPETCVLLFVVVAGARRPSAAD